MIELRALVTREEFETLCKALHVFACQRLDTDEAHRAWRVEDKIIKESKELK